MAMFPHVAFETHVGFSIEHCFSFWSLTRLVDFLFWPRRRFLFNFVSIGHLHFFLVLGVATYLASFRTILPHARGILFLLFGASFICYQVST